VVDPNLARGMFSSPGPGESMQTVRATPCGARPSDESQLSKLRVMSRRCRGCGSTAWA